MDRINHVKIVSPDPEAIDRFLREVLEIPEGWPLPGSDPQKAADAPRAAPRAAAASGSLDWDDVMTRRGADGTGGLIAGSEQSRQLQILRGPRARIWSVAIGTRHLERAHARCIERDIPCSEMRLVDWNEHDGIRAFYAEVGGILFEVLRVETKA